MKRGLKEFFSNLALTPILSNNLYPDEKGTERIICDDLDDVEILSNNLYPDEKGTERNKEIVRFDVIDA